MYLLGFDIGSSSIKAALVDSATGQVVAKAQSPQSEMAIQAPQADWAEQDPDTWWEHVCLAAANLRAQQPTAWPSVGAIGIAYQMHGLVLTDKDNRPLRPSIIWCDSRAVSTGESLLNALGEDYCNRHLLNAPGNFTAAKLRWVLDHEPALTDRIAHFMLPGDYIALRMTGEATTTATGLSEGILWDFIENSPSQSLLQQLGDAPAWLPNLVPAVGIQGRLSAEGAAQLGLPVGVPVTYRSGDQPNNALSLGVLNPGEVAATGGTSGVAYGVVDRPVFDAQGRINGFAHVNHSSDQNRIGILLCINGAGIQHGWMRRLLGGDLSYGDLEQLAASVATGAEGLSVLPFGNGAERMLGNRTPGGKIAPLNFNAHGRGHLVRAGLEGVAFAFVYGLELMNELGIETRRLRVGNDNLFQSAIFSETIATLTGAEIQLYDAFGAAGAARAAGVCAGAYAGLEEAVSQQSLVQTWEPQAQPQPFQDAYFRWRDRLSVSLSQ